MDRYISIPMSPDKARLEALLLLLHNNLQRTSICRPVSFFRGSVLGSLSAGVIFIASGLRRNFESEATAAGTHPPIGKSYFYPCLR